MGYEVRVVDSHELVCTLSGGSSEDYRKDGNIPGRRVPALYGRTKTSAFSTCSLASVCAILGHKYCRRNTKHVSFRSDSGQVAFVMVMVKSNSGTGQPHPSIQITGMESTPILCVVFSPQNDWLHADRKLSGLARHYFRREVVGRLYCLGTNLVSIILYWASYCKIIAGLRMDTTADK